jgi:predicted DNA binding CopG/RHH family protein
MDEGKQPARVIVTVRMRPASIEQLDRMAAADGVERATLIRTLLSEAVTQRLRSKR